MTRAKNKTTDYELNFIREHYLNMSIQGIATKLNRHPSHIYNVYHRLGLKTQRMTDVKLKTSDITGKHYTAKHTEYHDSIKELIFHLGKTAELFRELQAFLTVMVKIDSPVKEVSKQIEKTVDALDQCLKEIEERKNQPVDLSKHLFFILIFLLTLKG